MVGTPAVIDERDDDDRPGGDPQIPAAGKPQARQTQQADDTEFVIVDDDETPLAEGGTVTEERLDTEAGGERPLIDQGRQTTGRILSKEEVANMSPDQRRREWRALSRDDQRLNRHLDRARKKDNRERGQQETGQLRETVAAQAAELEKLRSRVEGFEPRFGEQQKQQLQGRIDSVTAQLAEENRKFQAATQRMSDAMVAQDSAALATALNDRDEAFTRRIVLNSQKQQFSQQLTAAPAAGDGGRRTDDGAPRAPAQERQQDRQQAQTQQPSSQVQRFINAFTDRNDWINDSDPEARRDIKRLWTLEQEIVAEGFNPSTEDYWDELEDRAREFIPHRFEDERPQQRQQRPNGRQQANGRPQNGNAAPARRGPPSAGGGDVRASGGRVEVKLTPARKEAMILAGVLERDGKTVIDKDKFRRQLKSFAAYDREHATDARQ